MERGKNLVAVIDVGSHETTMRIARLKRGSAPIVLDEVSRTIPIGIDTYTIGKISQVSLDQIIDVLNGFKSKLCEYGVTRLRAVQLNSRREPSTVLRNFFFPL